MPGNDYAQRLAAFGLGDEDLRAWQDSGLTPGQFDDWLTDRVARRPGGTRPGPPGRPGRGQRAQ